VLRKAGRLHVPFLLASADALEGDPATLRCPDNGASVDPTTCTPTEGAGAMQLSKAWKCKLPLHGHT